MNDKQARNWEKKRRRGFFPYALSHIGGVFLVITIVDCLVFGWQDTLAAAELRENFLVAFGFGLLISIIDWKRNEDKYQKSRLSDLDSGRE